METSLENNHNHLPLIEYFKEQLNLPEADMRSFSPLTLAYIGDCIYELVIRTMLIEAGNAPVNKLHKRASNLVKAAAQKDLFRSIENALSEEERTVFKRGRNAKSFTSAKNASISEYRIATGFEALMGYLYLNNQLDRLVELVKLGLDRMSNQDNTSSIEEG